MREQVEVISADEWMTLFMNNMEAGQKLKLAPMGYSMYPVLISKRDYIILKRIEEPLKRGDICLYRREDGRHILHTVWKVKKEGYYFLGDSQTRVEGPLARDQILAVAEGFIRKKREVSCASRGFRFLHGLWMRLRPLRPLFIWIWLKGIRPYVKDNSGK